MFDGTTVGQDDESASAPDPGGHAGLVLLYAPSFERLSPAYAFSAPELTIGRDASSPICVPDPAVSRQHARVFARGGRWVIEDLGSRNGTVVGGAYVTELELEAGHEVRVGDAIFKFVERDVERWLPYRIDGRTSGGRLSAQLTELLGGAQIDRIAAHVEAIAPTAAPVLVVGEAGTGKRLVARAIHRLSERSGASYAIDCAATPATTLERELFGTRRGAFPGADRDQPGLLELARGGTVLLEAVERMPLEAQSRLAHALASREVLPLGATSPTPIDVRLVCTTERALDGVRDGGLRGDLLAMLRAHTVALPPLRERKEDLVLLARSFGERAGRADLTFSFPFVLALLTYAWPLNVGELERCIARAVHVSEGAPLDTVHLPEEIVAPMSAYGERPPPASVARSTHPPATLRPEIGHVASATSEAAPPSRRAPTEEELRALLERHGGNVAAVGRALGKERMQIHRWVKRYAIDLRQYR